MASLCTYSLRNKVQVVIPVTRREETHRAANCLLNKPHGADSPRSSYTCTSDLRDYFPIAYTPIQTAAMGPEANPQLRLPMRSSQQSSSSAVMSHNLQECHNTAVPSKRPHPDSTSFQGGAGQLVNSAVSQIKSLAYVSR